MTDPAQPRFGSPIAGWHAWFSWHPVRTYDGRWIWITRLWRRRIQKHSSLDGGADQWWQYRYDVGYEE